MKMRINISNRVCWIALGILIVATSAGTVCWMLRSREAINSYDSCTKAGNPILESYPSVCVSKTGQHFTNPGEAVQNLQSISIVEWNVTVPLMASIGDATYTYNRNADTVYLTTRSLEQSIAQVQGCKSGLHGITYARALPGDKDEAGQVLTEADLAKRGIKIGDYYYYEKHTIEPACVSVSSQQGQVIGDIQKMLRSAFAHATENILIQ